MSHSKVEGILGFLIGPNIWSHVSPCEWTAECNQETKLGSKLINTLLGNNIEGKGLAQHGAPPDAQKRRADELVRYVDLF